MIFRDVTQWNRLKKTEINSYMYGQLIFIKGVKMIQREKNSHFNNWCWGHMDVHK